jgi:hypothetical protein
VEMELRLRHRLDEPAEGWRGEGGHALMLRCGPTR